MAKAPARRPARGAVPRRAPKPPRTLKLPKLSLAVWLQRLRRALPWLLMSAAVVAVMGLVIYLPRTLDFFPLQQVRVDGVQDERRLQEVRMAVTSEVSGDNFFSVSLSDLHDEIRALTWVSRVEVQRQWPGRIEIRVSERVPVAVWNDDQLVASNGEPFTGMDKYDVEPLPRLTGPHQRLTDVMEYYHSMSRILQDASLAVRSIRVDARLTARLELDNGVILVVDRDHYAQKLRRFVQLYQNVLEADSRTLAKVDLRYADGMAVTWAGNGPDRNKRV